jgi:hypothetical protein
MAKKSKLPAEPLKASTAPEATIARRSHEDEARERKYMAESALRDIERAEGHKRDKSLMKDVKACAREKMKAYGKL